MVAASWPTAGIDMPSRNTRLNHPQASRRRTDAFSRSFGASDGEPSRMPATLGIRAQGPEVTRICRSDSASPDSHHPGDMSAEPEYLHQRGKPVFSLEIVTHFRTTPDPAM